MKREAELDKEVAEVKIATQLGSHLDVDAERIDLQHV